MARLGALIERRERGRVRRVVLSTSNSSCRCGNEVCTLASNKQTAVGAAAAAGAQSGA